ncbi:MAG: hypothetical protein MZV65_17140 [Chromatiales bacterium]|nr:hypothetical protein [Chromatiales bacterium]
MATPIMASVKGERDIAVGNVVGSNIFNLARRPGPGRAPWRPPGSPCPQGCAGSTFRVMIAVALACLPVFLSDRVISRWEGWHFLGYYVAYTVYIFLGPHRITRARRCSAASRRSSSSP